MMSRENKKRTNRRKLTLLVVLVAFVFAILLISIAVSAILLYTMNHFGFMQPLSLNRLPMVLFFMLVVSLIIGIIITTLAGKATLRPLKKFIDATKEIAAGNFSVRVETRGPDEYSHLASSFNEMAKELGSIDTLRDDFVSTISHEYKTPIASIRGFAKMLKKGNVSKEQQEEYLDIIISETDRLTQLSSNVLLLSKLNSTDRLTEVARYDLDEQLRRAVLLLEPQVEKKQIELDIDLDSCSVVSSEELLQQVWINLIGNAIKFTPEGGRIGIAMRCGEGQVQVMVSDTGIGMDPEVMGHAFDKFYQGDRSRSSQGNGLGLALVKRIVTLCDGSIEVASQVGEGSVFTVMLPR